MRSAFDVHSATEATRAGQLDQWLEGFLSRDNPALLEGLKRVPRWWLGPRLMTLDDLHRACGPEEHMEFRMEPAAWERRLARLDAGFGTLDDFPPLIATPQHGRLSLRDGNTRHEMFRRRGLTHCWVLVWFNSAEDLQHFTKVFAGNRRRRSC